MTAATVATAVSRTSGIVSLLPPLLLLLPVATFATSLPLPGVTVRAGQRTSAGTATATATSPSAPAAAHTAAATLAHIDVGTNICASIYLLAIPLCSTSSCCVAARASGSGTRFSTTMVFTLLVCKQLEQPQQPWFSEPQH